METQEILDAINGLWITTTIYFAVTIVIISVWSNFIM